MRIELKLPDLESQYSTTKLFPHNHGITLAQLKDVVNGFFLL